MQSFDQDMLSAVHLWISKHPVFCVLAGLSVCGRSVMGSPLAQGTAATDGWNKYYDTAFMTSLTVPQRRFIVLHELCHQAYMHCNVDISHQLIPNYDHQRGGAAKDFFINGALVDMDNGKGEIVMPKGGLINPQFRGLSWVQIYHRLPTDGSGGSSMDVHIMSDPSDGSDSADGEPADGENQAGVQAQRSAEIDLALRQGKIMSERLQAQGSGTGGALGVLDDLLYPKLNWRELLSEFIISTCARKDLSTWARPNRRHLAQGMYLPSMYSESAEKIVVVFDTSGSCFGGVEMQAFAAELSGLIELVCPEKTVVLYVDSEVSGMQVFEDGAFAVADMQPKGGGGTNLEVAYAYMEQNGHADAQAVIFLTDGYTDMSRAPRWPVLWAMTTDVVAPYGRTCRIEL